MILVWKCFSSQAVTTSENGRVTSTSRVDADALADELYEIQTRFHRSVDSLRDLVEANRSTLKHVEAMLVQSLDEKSNNSAQSRISSRRSSIAMLTTRRKSTSPLPSSLARRSSMSSPHHENPFAAVIEKRLRKRSSIGSLFDARLAQKQKLRSKRRISNRPTQDYSNTDNTNKNSGNSNSERKLNSSASSQFKKPLISDKSLFM